LRVGNVVKGPALIEEEASVTVLDAGHVLMMHPHGHMLIEATE
jgi:N-methylhydantoinase A